MVEPLGPSRKTALMGFLAALSWCVSCVAWFEDGAPFRPHWLSALPAPVLLLGLVPLFIWLRGRSAVLWGSTPRWGMLVFVACLAFFFRLPLAIWGACGYTTPDGALSGIVALHVRLGIAHHVFIPSIPYSGSLKSHLAALLSYLIDLPRAFALSSIIFYAVFVAGVSRLALFLDPDAALPAGLYLAFSPAFVTHYSLSNDGNYVEVLAFGTWALVLVVRAALEERSRPVLATGIGLLLGLGLWAHLLAIIYVATAFLVLLFAARSLPVLFNFCAALVIGYFPGVLWNLGHGWDSLIYILPGAHPMKSVVAGPGVLGRAVLMVQEQWPILMGYDPGYDPLADRFLMAASLVAIALVSAGVVRAARDLKETPAWGVLLLFTLVNLTVATVSLPHVSENPRYILFLMSAVPIFLGHVMKGPRSRMVLAALVATGALASLAQAPPKLVEDVRWRQFVADLEKADVKACYTDFYLASKIDFLSGERVVCSSKLGPTFTEYFDYRARVESAPEAALVPVNDTAAEKVARRLERLGVSYKRLDLMKPTFKPARNVDPQELFPEKALPER